MKGNVIQMNTLHLNSVRLNGIGKVQSVSLKGGSTEDPVFPPVEPPVEPTPTYTLSASVTNGKVSAKRNGSAVNLPFTANEGDTIVVEVTPNDGYSFEGWNDGNTDNPRSITMTADVVLSAQCVEVVVPPAKDYIQFEDKAVEAICVANWSSDGIGLTEEDAAAVTSIGTTFKGNTDITSFNEFRYFTGVTSLSANAFDGCTALTSIAFDNIVTMNVNAIYNCNSLTQIILPNIIRIESYQQRYNSVLAKIDIGENCTYIANRAFSDCANVAAIICRATTPPALGYATALATNNCLIYVPDASLEAYRTATNWNTYADRIHPLSEIEDYYISDALLMHLDGINKGGVDGEWRDLVGSIVFTNKGATAADKYWHFDGSGYLESNDTGYRYSENRTIEIVFEIENFDANAVLLAMSASQYGFGLFKTSGVIAASMDMNSVVYPLSYTKGSIATVAITRSTLYTNGEVIASTQQSSIAFSDDTMYIGRRSTGNNFYGKIYAIRIHDRALSEEEILYNQRIDNKRFNLGLDI